MRLTVQALLAKTSLAMVSADTLTPRYSSALLYSCSTLYSAKRGDWILRCRSSQRLNRKKLSTQPVRLYGTALFHADFHHPPATT